MVMSELLLQQARRTAWDAYEALRRSVSEDAPEGALAQLATLQGLERDHPSSSGVVQAYVMALGALGGLARGGVPAIAALAQAVEQKSEPWLEAELDGFMDVFQDARHAALHTLMHAAARAGDLSLALDLYRRGDAGNEKVFVRWQRQGIPGSPGIHAVYPSAYGAAQMMPYLIAARRYDAIPGLLDRLQDLTQFALGVPDEFHGEFHDAFGDEEGDALATLVADGNLPEPLRQRCRARQDELARMAQPPEAWPRTWSHLPKVRLVV